VIFFFLSDLQGSYMMLFVFSTTWRAYLLWVIFSLYEKINNKDFSGVSSAGSGLGFRCNGLGIRASRLQV
jgi:hypothetical protein